MAIDLGADSIIRAGSGLLFVLLGLAIALRASATKVARTLGAFSAFFGVGFILFNLFADDAQLGRLAVDAVGVSYVFIFLSGLVLVAWLPPAVRAERWAFVAVGALFAAYAVAEWTFWAQEWISAYGAEIYGVFGYLNPFQVGTLVLLPLLCAMRYALQPVGAPSADRAALPLLALTFGPYVGVALGEDSVRSGQTNFASTPEAALVLLAVVVATSALWLWCSARERSPLLVLAALAPLAAALVGMTSATFLGEERTYGLGLFGVARILGWLALVSLCLRHPKVGLKLPGLRPSRSAVAMGALAALFIVAQIAQNFFAAQYGLLLGGIVAGTFVFAAQPIQRAIERGGQRSPGAAKEGNVAQEERFRNALRLALRDKRLSREEEILLHQLAEGLGISAGRAHELLVEVERQSGKKAK